MTEERSSEMQVGGQESVIDLENYLVVNNLAHITRTLGVCIAQGRRVELQAQFRVRFRLRPKLMGMDPHVSLSVGVAGRSARRVFFLHGEDVRGEVILREKQPFSGLVGTDPLPVGGTAIFIARPEVRQRRRQTPLSCTGGPDQTRGAHARKSTHATQAPPRGKAGSSTAAMSPPTPPIAFAQLQ